MTAPPATSTVDILQSLVGFDKAIRILAGKIDQIAEDHKFRKRPTAADIFDDGFLPPADIRLIN